MFVMVATFEVAHAGDIDGHEHPKLGAALKGSGANWSLSRWGKSTGKWGEKDIDHVLELAQAAKEPVPLGGLVDQPVKRINQEWMKTLLSRRSSRVADEAYMPSAIRIDIVYTTLILPSMSKGRSRSSESLGSTAVAEVERASAADTKGTINLRIETQTRQLIDDAAAILGKTRTEFMIESARRQAIDVLLDQRLFVLDADRYDAFMHALDNPPAPGPRLRSLLRRIPAWQK
jgi:uncharacterized protein (DUF1778 family)